MLVQARNQANRECLYAWYPESVANTVTLAPRDIYILNGIDQNLLVDRSTNTDETVKSDSKARSVYTNETIDEALRTPWALDYEIKRRPASSNLRQTGSSSNDEQTTNPAVVVPRRLKSAPVRCSKQVSTSSEKLTIPQPRFDVTSNAVRVASAKARLNTTISTSNPTEIVLRREVKSAQGIRTRDATKLSEEEIQQIFQRVYGDSVDQQTIANPSSSEPAPPTTVVIYKNDDVPPAAVAPPVQIYKRSSSWSCETRPETIDTKTIEVSAIPLNPHYIHRPGVIAIRNQEKKVIVRAHSASRKNEKCSHRRLQHSKRTEPLRATGSLVPKRRLSLEIDGIQLTYDPKLTLNDRSNNLTKYFLDGRLYLIKDYRYNIVDNIDPSTIEKYNRTLSFANRSKSNPGVPIETISRSTVRGNRPETYLYKTSPSDARRFMVYDHLNINKMPLSQRPPIVQTEKKT